MRFGIKTGQGQSGYTYDELSSVWSKSEELGFDSAWLHDHLLGVSLVDRASDPCLEAYTTLAALARDTKRLRIGVMVTCVGYRNPAYLAKMGATVDRISNGRFVMGVGAGWHEAEYAAYGYDFLPLPDRLGQLKETLKILRMMWTEDGTSFAGRHFSITNATCNPKPVQAHLPVWVGVSTGTRTLPRYAVELADGLNTVAEPKLCGKIVERAEEVRKEMKRDRSEVTYSAQPLLLAGTDSEVEQIVQKEAERMGMSPNGYRKKLREKGCIVGTPEHCAEELRAYARAGVEYLIPMIIGDRLLWPLEAIKDRLIPLI